MPSTAERRAARNAVATYHEVQLAGLTQDNDVMVLTFLGVAR